MMKSTLSTLIPVICTAVMLSASVSYSETETDDKYYCNGNLASEWVDSEEGRVYRTYYKSGRLWSEESYINGKEEGVSRKYYFSGQIMEEVPYENGKKNGAARYYSEDGDVTKVVKYENGREVKSELPE